MSSVADETGISYAAVRRISRMQGRVTSKDFAARIADVYDRWRHTDGPSAITRSFARSQDWSGPDDWQNIDDPLCKSLNWQERAALRRDEIIHFAWHGDTPEQILARLNNEVSISTVRQIVQEWRTGQKRDRKAVAA
jgi:hypothetical protein